MTWINSYLLLVNRHVRAFFYRLVLLVYGILLAFVFPSFSVYFYVVIFILYAIYIRLYVVKSSSNTIVRSITDLIFIALCLYGKPLDNICVIAMIFIPVANAINHTGKSSGSNWYVLGLMFIYILLLLLGDYDDLKRRILHIVIAFASFLAIQWFTKKNWIQNSRGAILKDSVEDFYIHGIKNDVVYKKIGQMFIEEHYPFLSMYCFISHNDFKSLSIVNGTSFVYNYSIALDEDKVNLIKEELISNNIFLIVDGIKYDKNIVIAEPASSFKDNIHNTSYLFVLCFETNVSSNVWIVQSIKKELLRLSQYLYSERIMKLRRKENFEQIKDKGRFVDSAINTMHFIKNRLSSLQTLVDVVNDMDASNIDGEYIEVAKKAAQRSTIDIQSILQKAKYLLNKETNPFHYQATESCKPRRIFATLRQVWENVLSNSTLIVENTDLLNSETYYVKTNMEGIEILFSDIIGNMLKYQKTQSACICSCDEMYLTIKFKNDFYDKTGVLALVKAYNVSDKEEIIKRKTFGVSNIKSFVSDMGIQL